MPPEIQNPPADDATAQPRIGIPVHIPAPGPELATPAPALTDGVKTPITTLTVVDRPLIERIGDMAWGAHADPPDATPAPAVAGPRMLKIVGTDPRADGSPVGASFPLYARWRVTKCKPRDMAVPAERIEELDQAIHEVVGECGEMGELWNANGLDVFRKPELIAKLADEVGDVFFCGSWALDAWVGGHNPLRLWPFGASTELITDAEAKVGHHLGIILRAEAADKHDHQTMYAIAQSCLIAILTNASLLSNSFKKLKFQRREQDESVQVDRIMYALTYCNHLLAMAGLRVDDALAKNVNKLDARYPDGYVPGQGGGNRTGEGQ